MPRQNYFQTLLNGGELSPEMQARADYQGYKASVEKMSNFLPTVYGSARKRPALEYIYPTKDPTRKVRLIPFIFSTDDSFILEVGHLYMRFYYQGGLVMDGGSPYEIVTPFPEEQLERLYVAQSADVMYIVHGEQHPVTLERYGATDWRLEEINFTSRPNTWTPGNYPKTVCFYEDRVWYGGALNRPQTLWASKSGDYNNFTLGSNADDALEYTIATDQVNAIRWLSPGKVLAVGTTGGEFIVSASSLEEAITPDNVRIVRQTNYGAVFQIPMRVGTAVIFATRSKRKVREMAYSFEADAYQAPDLTVLANHITPPGIEQMALQEEPYDVIWARRTDGQLLAMTYDRSNDVVAWSRHPVVVGPDNAVESLAVIPSDDGTQDQLWVATSRTIDGTLQRQVERLCACVDPNHMDSRTRYQGPPATIITGLDHLEGEEVVILRDDTVHPNRVVQGGQIELQLPGSDVYVGKELEATITTLSLEAGAAIGTAQGSPTRIHETVIRVLNTGEGLCVGPSEEEVEEVPMREPGMNMDERVPDFTGDLVVPFDASHDSQAKVTLCHDTPLPCTILGIIMKAETNES